MHRDTSRAQILAEELEKSYPPDTIRKFYWLPTIRAAMELDANNPTQAVVFLEAAAPYDLGWPPQLPVPTMYPVYIRGQTELAAGNGVAAATEFQKFLAKAAYQDFLALWKDAGPHIPLLKQAKAECASLQ